MRRLRQHMKRIRYKAHSQAQLKWSNIKANQYELIKGYKRNGMTQCGQGWEF